MQRAKFKILPISVLPVSILHCHISKEAWWEYRRGNVKKENQQGNRPKRGKGRSFIQRQHIHLFIFTGEILNSNNLIFAASILAKAKYPLPACSSRRAGIPSICDSYLASSLSQQRDYRPEQMRWSAQQCWDMDLHSAQDREGGSRDCAEGWNPAKCCVSYFGARASLKDDLFHLFIYLFFYSRMKTPKKFEWSAGALQNSLEKGRERKFRPVCPCCRVLAAAGEVRPAD